MKITKAEVIVSCPGRNFVTLIIETDEGVSGLGDATLNGRELAVATYLQEHLIPCIIGRDPFDTEDIWQYLYRGVYWRRGAVNMTAIGAIDMALWDIKGKVLGTPIYKLIGGKSRHKLLTYTHAQAFTLEDTLEEVAKKQEIGFKALRVQSGVPGLDKIYGISKDKSYEPAVTANVPTEESWDTSKYLNYLPKLMQSVRERFGDGLHLLHDAHHRLMPIEAARLGKELEPFHLFWLEDVVPAENQESLKLVRNHTTTPLAIGEVFNTVFDCKELIEKEYIDYIRMTVAHGGGLTPMVKIAHLAELHHVKFGCHGPSDLSPVNMAASIHFGTAINNFGIQEYMGYNPVTMEVFELKHAFEDGHFLPSDEPGLGITFDVEKAKKYEYKPAYLPVNRLTDGTLYHW